MANFVFKRTETKNMKIAGIVDVQNMTIEVDGDEKNLSTLLSPFDNMAVEIKVVIKDEEELDEPTSEEDEE